jgi:hypothetical protein
MLRRGFPGWTGQSLKQGGRVVGHHTEAFVGIETSKLRNAVTIADGGRGGEVRYLGGVSRYGGGDPEARGKACSEIPSSTFCYEAGPTGYGLYRLLKSLGHESLVVAQGHGAPPQVHTPLRCVQSSAKKASSMKS